MYCRFHCFSLGVYIVIPLCIFSIKSKFFCKYVLLRKEKWNMSNIFNCNFSSSFMKVIFFRGIYFLKLVFFIHFNVSLDDFTSFFINLITYNKGMLIPCFIIEHDIN